MASAVVVATALPAHGQNAKPVLLRTPVAFSTAAPGPGTTIRWIADRLETASSGSIKMRLYEPGKLIAPFEILGAVSAGKVNAGYATASHWGGKMPAARLFSAVPFGPEAGEYLAWLWYGNGMRLYQKMYDQAGYDVKVLVCGILPPRSSGWFAREVHGPEDLVDLKMRFFGLGGEVMKKLGVSVRPLAAEEIASALENESIDAAEFSTPAVERGLGFHKLVRYNYFPGWHHQASTLELLINKKEWNGLHESQRLLLEIMCKAVTADSFAEGEAMQFEVISENVTKDKVQLRYWPEDMLDLFEQTWKEIAKEQAARDRFFKEVWEDLSEFRAKYEIWRAYAFLPRGKRK